MGEIGWFLPRRYWSPLAFKILLACELPFSVGILTLTGIAAPNLYRTRLWQDGADNGFNSSPNQKVYAFANYQPYTTPKPWSQFITNFNLVITVLSLFFFLTKTPMFVMEVFYPPLSVLVHGICILLYSVAAAYQGASDTSDPKHPQNGPPWYITKNCNVASLHTNVNYCNQAKATFALTIVMIFIFLLQLILAVVSCFPTEEDFEKKRLKEERKSTLAELRSMKSPLNPDGTMSFPLTTPRTTAFNKLEGNSDLPLRDRSDSYSTMPREEETHEMPKPPEQAQMYFPPPPQAATKGKA
ncbi:hypothetical protein MGYG_01680 [Nannizzia gypsea CBS 118893]|uniref:MARVEL domain-containing protein n=1 Tax=Arthroderma gypseum (strain ATCC MYA-4604 / CBS 118893) TaxID=535722 RepID=E5R2K0_ARTGP|nr:hypothetical protein MGYG_01680 [Nannizzia gypsea CBS 118893]EFQ98658.1 hypothetical protein MGYG_01680 [Nannizzia gypsea CBS 118893]